MKNRSRFKKDSSQLQEIFRFLNKSWESISLDQKTMSELELAVEELFMNIVRYNPDKNSLVDLRFDNHSDKIEIMISTREEKAFDITKTGQVDLDDYIAKEKSGGLGIHLIKELMDEVHFEHTDGISAITIIKYLPD